MAREKTVAVPLEVGTNGKGDVVIRYSHLPPSDNGIGHFVFSPREAEELARILSGTAVFAQRQQKCR